MMKIQGFLMLCIISLCISCASKKTAVRPSTPEPVGFKFVKNANLTSSLEQAKKEGKLVFVDVMTDWCLPCKLMDEDVFSDKDLGDFFNDKFVNVKIDAEKNNGPELAMLFQVYAYPTLLFLDTNGRVLSRKDGAAYHTELKDLADSAILASTESF